MRPEAEGTSTRVAPGSFYRIALALRRVFDRDFRARLGRRPPGLGVPFEDLANMVLSVARVETGPLVFLGYAIWHVGNSLSLLLGAMMLCALPVLSTAAGNLLLFIGQGQEFLREYGVAFIPGATRPGLQGYAALPLLLALPVWALTNWYCARQLMTQSFRVPREFAGFLPGRFGRLLKKYLPRLLALASLLPLTLFYAGITAPGSAPPWGVYAALAAAVMFLFDWIFHRDQSPRPFAWAMLIAGLALSLAGLGSLATRDGWPVPGAYALMLAGLLGLFQLRARRVALPCAPSRRQAAFHALQVLAAWAALAGGALLFAQYRRHPEQLALWFLLAFAAVYGFTGWRRLLWPTGFGSVLRHTRRLRGMLNAAAALPPHRYTNLINQIAPGLIAHLVQAFRLALDKAIYDLRQRGVGIGTLLILLFLNFLAFSLTWGIERDPVGVGTFLRALPVGLLALAGITLFGSLALYLLPKALGLPSLLLVPPLLAVLAGQSLDNHGLPAVRPQAAARHPGPERPTLAGHFAAWKARRGAGEDYPVFIVAAAGGGHRAAAWTAQVLTRLEDATGGEFSRHVYAISGVSGGSLGAASFVAALADGGGASAEPDRARPSARTARLSAFYARDFISPVLAYMLFPDLMQRFWPESTITHDRAWALESTWEQAWEATRPSAPTSVNRFAAPFLDLYSGQGGLELPLLFFNATSVEEGKRVVAAPVRSRHEDAYDLLGAELVTGDIRLSTAVHNSARFTYVSPAGTVLRLAEGGAQKPWGRVVDGGYFENSGALTAREILEQLAALQGHRRNLYVILISNEPRPPGQRICASPLADVHRARDVGGVPHKTPPPDRPLLPEMSAPLGALAATREARGALAEVDLVNAVGSCAQAFEVYLAQSDQAEFRDPALGWFLSSASLANMDNALDAAGGGRQPARRELERIAARILGAQPPGGAAVPSRR